MGPKEQAVRATLPGRPAAILYEDSELRRKINHCFAGLFNGAVQGSVSPNGGLFLNKAECEWDWQQVWPAMKELGLVDYAIEEVTHPTGYVSQEFRWHVTDKGREVREDDDRYFRALMDAMEEDDPRPIAERIASLAGATQAAPAEPADIEQSIATGAWTGESG